MERNELETKLLEMPDKIANQGRRIMERALEIELERKGVVHEEHKGSAAIILRIPD